MITEQDLREAIAECEGVRHPTSKTCINLAAFYIIRDHMYPEAPTTGYSTEAPAISHPVEPVEIGDSEFLSAVSRLPRQDAWRIVDELMDAVKVLHPRLYSATIRKLNGM